MTTDLDASILPDDWANALSERAYDVEALYARVDAIYDKSTNVLPARRDVFRAFHLTQTDDVRVVILGQDPYPLAKWKAHGLAFSSPVPRPFPRSLNAIFRNLEQDSKVEFTRPAIGDLTPWAQRGVLLLNTALTVEQRRAGSHGGAWAYFTKLVLEILDSDRDGEDRGDVVFLLWGNHAISRAKAAGIKCEAEVELPQHVVLSAHPSARGTRDASRQDAFKDCRPFSTANEFLTEPIDWNLCPSSQD